MRLFMRRDWDVVSAAEIAAAAGVGEKTADNYFPVKAVMKPSAPARRRRENVQVKGRDRA
jgi:Bacterial regulatory proteins, tetR family